jgi:subtilisin family serine protease
VHERVAALTAIGLVVVLAGVVGGAVVGPDGTGTATPGENVTIDRTLAESTGTVEVLVELADAETDSGVQGLQAHATVTQEPLVRFAGRTEGVSVERQFWLTNAVLVAVDTGQVSVDTLAGIDQVQALRANGRVSVDTGRTVGPGPTDRTGAGVSAGTAVQTGAEPGAGVSSARDVPAVASTDLETESYDTTYGLAQINATTVWDTYGTQGGGASVAVLDTGVDADHPDIDLTKWAEFDENGNEVDSEPQDYGEHGTHVSGTVAGGAESGVHVGVAPEADLYHAAVLTDCEQSCTGSFSQVIAGMEWAVEEGVDVMSMSLGVDGYESAFIDPVRSAQDAGVTVVASIGNSGEGSSASPGNVYDAISVGASDESANITGFSAGEDIDTLDAWGPEAPLDWPDEYTVPSVAAPGANVYSTYPGGEYNSLFGTSMAAPHVSGAVALMASVTTGNVTPGEFGAALEETAWKPDEWNEPEDQRDSRYGSGIVDVPAAVASLPVKTPLHLAGVDAPAEVDPEKNLTVAYTVENTGEETATESAVRLLVEGTGETPDDADTNVTVDANETVDGTLTFDGVGEQFDHGDTIAFTVELVDTGDSANGTADVVAAPPEFAVGVLDAEDILAGEELTVTAGIENVGGREGTQTVTLSVPGLGENETSVTLNAGESVEESLGVGTGQDDEGEYTATVTSENETDSANVTVSRKSVFAVSGVDAPAVVAGETLTVTAEVENTGNEAGTQTVTLAVPGLGSNKTNVSLDAGESTAETLGVDTGEGDAGEYTATVTSENESNSTAAVVEKPATAALSTLDVAGDGATATVVAGEAANISVVVENTGEESGSFEVTLAVGSAVERNSTTGKLGGGATERVTFENVTGGLDNGTYGVTVAAPEDTVGGELTVEAAPTLTFPDQNRSKSGAAVVENVASTDEAVLVVTYETESETVVAGAVNNTFDAESVPVVLAAHVGFPDQYTAHLLSAANANSYEPGEALSTDTAEAILVSESARVTTVTGAPDVEVTGDSPAKDTTGDGILDDVDGDGAFDIFDVQTLFNELGSDAVQSHPALFNFNGDDDPEEVSIFDVQGLFNSLG